MVRRHLLHRLTFGRPRFIAAALTVAGGFLALPVEMEASLRPVVAWDLGLGVYLVATWVMMLRSDEAALRRRARRQDIGQWLILGLALAGAGATIAALVGYLREAAEQQSALGLALVFWTILSAFAMVHTLFAVHYAHAFFAAPKDKPPLIFPGGEVPDYGDFLYFAFVLGVAAQVSDVAVAGRSLRRTVLLHGVAAFFFNTVVLALVVNIAATLLQPGGDMRWLRRLFLLLIGLPLAYGALALLGALPLTVPEPPDGETVTIYVQSNGAHIDLVLPMRALGVDWSAEFQAGDFPFSSPALASHAGFGWGDRDFYLNTPTWAELTPGRALGALFASKGALMHVTLWGRAPQRGETTRAVTLGEAQYRRLVRDIRASFSRDSLGRVQLIPGFRYGADDAFYEAAGRYSLIETCNEWAAARLRKAGVPVGEWSPFPFGIMWNL